jgi:type IV pilus assembly protein PilV
MKMTPRPWRGFRGGRRSAGFSLIEVLIAVVILAFGLLGIASLQMATLRKSQSALQRSQATMQTYAILDAMRANREAARIGAYNLTTMTCATPEPSSLAARDLANWMGSLKQAFGESACGKVVCGSVECEISVRWNDERARGSSEQTITTVTRL